VQLPPERVPLLLGHVVDRLEFGWTLDLDALDGLLGPAKDSAVERFDGAKGGSVFAVESDVDEPGGDAGDAPPPPRVKEAIDELRDSDELGTSISRATADEEAVRTRLAVATRIFANS
jgi:hypothetical protein